MDGVIKYVGANNDRDMILVAVGGSSPTSTTMVYLQSDLDMNGVARYTGSGNDRDIILFNIGGVVATQTRVKQTP